MSNQDLDQFCKGHMEAFEKGWDCGYEAEISLVRVLEINDFSSSDISSFLKDSKSLLAKKEINNSKIKDE